MLSLSEHGLCGISRGMPWDATVPETRMGAEQLFLRDKQHHAGTGCQCDRRVCRLYAVDVCQVVEAGRCMVVCGIVARRYRSCDRSSICCVVCSADSVRVCVEGLRRLHAWTLVCCVHEYSRLAHAVCDTWGYGSGNGAGLVSPIHVCVYKRMLAGRRLFLVSMPGGCVADSL